MNLRRMRPIFSLTNTIHLRNGFLASWWSLDLLTFQITIDSYIPATFGNKFRFRSREDMRRLLHSRRLPDNIILEDGSSISGEFVRLFSIRRLATHTNLDDFAQFEFGREYSVLSRVFNFFVRYTYHTFRNKLSNNIPFFVHNIVYIKIYL